MFYPMLYKYLLQQKQLIITLKKIINFGKVEVYFKKYLNLFLHI